MRELKLKKKSNNAANITRLRVNYNLSVTN